MPDVYSVAAPVTSYFTPLQDPPAGIAFDPQPNGKPIPKLFQPLTIRGLTLHNRIFVSRVSMHPSSLREADIYGRVAISDVSGILQQWVGDPVAHRAP